MGFSAGCQPAIWLPHAPPVHLSLSRGPVGGHLQGASPHQGESIPKASDRVTAMVSRRQSLSRKTVSRLQLCGEEFSPMMVFASRTSSYQRVPVLSSRRRAASLTTLTGPWDCPPPLPTVKHYQRPVWRCLRDQFVVAARECDPVIPQIYFLNVMFYKIDHVMCTNYGESASGSNCVQSLILHINSLKMHSLCLCVWSCPCNSAKKTA